MRIFFLGFSIALTVARCNDSNMVKSSAEQSDSTKNKGDVLAVNMDMAVSPSQDFFSKVCVSA